MMNAPTMKLAASPGLCLRAAVRNVYTINRGYEDLAARLNSLGAQIEVLHGL